MAYTFSVNNTPTNGSQALYLLVACLMAAGWTQPDASDGTTRAANRITGGATGNNGLGNANAWVRLRAPIIGTQNREVTIQRGAADFSWRFKYSATAGFITGGSATATPSATDEVVILGTGTDAVPTFNANWFSTNGTYRFHCIAGGAAESYSFLSFAVTTGTTNNVGGCFMLDVLAAGSYPASDPDPAVCYACTAQTATALRELAISTTGATVNVINPALARAWLGALGAAGIATTGTNNQNVGTLVYGGSVIGGGGSIPSNPFTSKDELLAVPWFRSATSVAPAGWKGYSTLLYFAGTVRTNMDTYDLATVRDRLYLNTFSIPWSGALPTI